MRRYTLIGGSGFIGTRIGQILKERGNQFEIIDIRRSATFSDQTKLADIREFESLNKSVTGDTIIHLAAAHTDNIKDKSIYYSTNVVGTKNVCEVATSKNIRRLVFTSSVAVYGHAKCGADESAPRIPFNEYGRTKKFAEDELKNWQSRNIENKLIIVRPTVVFGENNRGNVYNLLKQIHSRQFVMIGNGRNQKSLAYVGNVAAFLLHTADSNIDNATVNYVDEPALTMHQLVSMSQQIMEIKPTLRLRLPKAVGLLASYMADTASALSGIPSVISSIRVKKFCADSSFSRGTSVFDDYQPPTSLYEALTKTIIHEFKSNRSATEVF
jgi:nucleoside-diphosphate-sugar epimerase